VTTINRGGWSQSSIFVSPSTSLKQSYSKDITCTIRETHQKHDGIFGGGNRDRSARRRRSSLGSCFTLCCSPFTLCSRFTHHPSRVGLSCLSRRAESHGPIRIARKVSGDKTIVRAAEAKYHRPGWRASTGGESGRADISATNRHEKWQIVDRWHGEHDAPGHRKVQPLLWSPDFDRARFD